MCFLYLNEDTEAKVEITKEGMQLPEVVALYKTDKKTEKTFFKKCITYIFWVYNPMGMYKNILLSARRQKVCNVHLNNIKPEDIEKNELVQKLITTYIDFCTTPTERLIVGCNKKIDELLTRLNNIPLTKKVTIQGEHNGKSYKEEVDIDNSEESDKALKLAKGLLEYQEILNKKLILEKKETKKKEDVEKRLFSDSKR